MKKYESFIETEKQKKDLEKEKTEIKEKEKQMKKDKIKEIIKDNQQKLKDLDEE